jgi:protein scribble
LQAKKRAAWREARLKSLEQDAMQAEMVIKKMNELKDDSIASRHNISTASAISTNDGNGNNNQGEPDNSNNNQVPETVME